jgi:hypothetical protein
MLIFLAHYNTKIEAFSCNFSVLTNIQEALIFLYILPTAIMKPCQYVNAIKGIFKKNQYVALLLVRFYPNLYRNTLDEYQIRAYI